MTTKIWALWRTVILKAPWFHIVTEWKAARFHKDIIPYKFTAKNGVILPSSAFWCLSFLFPRGRMLYTLSRLAFPAFYCIYRYRWGSIFDICGLQICHNEKSIKLSRNSLWGSFWSCKFVSDLVLEADSVQFGKLSLTFSLDGSLSPSLFHLNRNKSN